MLRHICPSGTVAIILGMAYMCSVTFGTVEAKARAVPCPNEEDISPCVCTAYPDFSMDMDCSAVTSSNELALAFNAEFPFLDFNNLFIRNNTYITTLRVGDLGQATFQRITISDGGLKTVVDRALVNSYGTLLVLDLSGNALIDFPFDEISLFTYLDQLDFQNNKISSFPHLYSTSLSILQMGYNPLQTIGSSSLKNLPNLEEISLISAQLTSMDPGTLYGLGNLQVVHLEYNSLTMLLANTIQVTGPSNIVHLNNNLLANIEVNAIEGANFQVWIQDNKLTKLPEDVWQPMFDANIRLSARNNNITCDCEIAWIVLDANNLAHLADNPTCASGEPILELDTSLFLELCT